MSDSTDIVELAKWVGSVDQRMARLGIALSIYTELLSQRVGDLMARRDLGVLAELALDAADELLEQHHIRIREEAEGGGQ